MKGNTVKDVSFILEFTRHVLANGTAPNGDRDRFQRDSTGKLIWEQSWWYSAFNTAIELSRMRGIKAADIHMNLTVEADTELYKRRYGEDKFRTHEAIMPGTQVTFEAMVSDQITESNLTVILERMGTYVGLSPYGYRLGYGKFNVIEVSVAPSDSGSINDSENSDS